MRLPAAELTATALRGLLDRLGGDAEKGAAELAALHRRLWEFFDRRGVPEPALLADETLDRVARRLEEGEAVESVRAYCYGVAKRVMLEWHREHAREAAALRESLQGEPPASAPLDEARVACLERCLGELPSESREFILRYYQGQGSVHLGERKGLAEALAVSSGALKMRAYRIRGQLEDCLARCLGEGSDR